MSQRTKILAQCWSNIFNWKNEPQQKRRHYLKSNINMKGSILNEISQISEILDGQLYLSGVAPLTEESLKTLGITAVVCALTELEEKAVASPSYINMPIKKIYVRLLDSESSDLYVYFEPITEIIQYELEKGGKVLVHCLAGISRSSTLVMAYLMRYRNYALFDAYDYVAEKRKIIQPNDGFFLQLSKYEALVKENVKMDLVKALSANDSIGKALKVEFPMDTINEEVVSEC